MATIFRLLARTYPLNSVIKYKPFNESASERNISPNALYSLLILFRNVLDADPIRSHCSYR
jgi:hypothetical protein